MPDNIKKPLQINLPVMPTPNVGTSVGNPSPVTPTTSENFINKFNDPNLKLPTTGASGTKSYNYTDAVPYISGFGSSGFIGDASAEFNAQNQRWYHQLSNGVSKGLGLAGTTLVSGTVGLLDGLFSVADSAVKGNFDFSKIYDNDTNVAMDQFNQNMEKWFPNYYSKKELDASAFSSDNLLTWNFLADKLIKNAGFAAGAIMEGYLTAGIASELKLGKLALGYQRALRAGKVEAAMMSHGDDAVAMGKSLLEFAEKQSVNLATLENKAINNMSMVMSTAGESSMEAFEGKKRVAEDLRSQQEQILGRSLTETELKIIDDKAAVSGNIRLGLNFALLNFTNRIQFPKILNGGFKGGRETLGREMNDIAVNGVEGSVVGNVARTGETYVARTEAQKLGKLSKAWDYSKKAATIISPSETFEEGSQYIFDKATARNAGVMNPEELRKAKSDYENSTHGYLSRSSDPYKMAELEDILSTSVKSLFTDKEGLESMILGGLTGGIMEHVGGGQRKESKQKSQNTSTAINLFNNNLASGYIKERAKAGVASLSIEEDNMKNIASGDIMGSANNREDSFINFAIPRLFYGRGEMAKDELMQYHSSQMKYEDAKTELGLSDSFKSSDLDKHIEDSVKELESLEKILQHVEAVSPYLFQKDGSINNLSKGLVYAGYKINAFEKRINKMVSELSGIGLTDTSLLLNPKARKEAGYDFESLRNKLNGEIKTAASKIIDPVTKLPVNSKEYQDKLYDIERLQNLREQYINDYTQMKDGSYFYNAVFSKGMILDDSKLTDYEKFERYMLDTQRTTEYGKNTQARRTAALLSNKIETILSSKTPVTIDVLKDLATTLKDELGNSFLLDSDKKHIDDLITVLKNQLNTNFNISQFNGLDQSILKQVSDILNDAPNAVDASSLIHDLNAYVIPNESNPVVADLYEDLSIALNKFDDSLTALAEVRKSLASTAAVPEAKTQSELKREIANIFTDKAGALISSFNLDSEGFTDVDELSAGLVVIKNLKRLFTERDNTFFVDNSKGFKNKTDYLNELDLLITELEDALEQTKKNAENIEKDDLNFAETNRNNKARIFGYDIILKSIFDQPLYDSIAAIVSEAKLKELLEKHQGDTTNKYIYELYQLYRNALNKNPILSTSILSNIENELNSLQALASSFNNPSVRTFTNKDLIFKNPYKYFDYLISTFATTDLASRYKQSQNIELFLDTLKKDPGLKLSNDIRQITDSEFIQLLEIGLKQKQLIGLQNLTNLNSSFSYSKYWDAVEEYMIATKDSITPTMRQLQVVEELIMHLFTDKKDTSFSNWAYLNGRIGSGKTKVVASTLLKVLSNMTGIPNATSFSYLVGDSKIAGFNLESALGIYQTGIPQVITGTEGRDIQMLIQDLTNNHSDLKGKRFILGDEFARASTTELKDLDVALLDYNKRNGTSLQLICMGDTNQSSNSSITDNITTIGLNMNLVTPLGTSYRSTLFSINLIQALYDNAKTASVATYRQRLLDGKKAEMAAERDPAKKAKLKRQIDSFKPLIDLVSMISKDAQGNEIVGGYRYGVTGVAKGTSFKTAEDDLIADLVLRSNKINLPIDPSLPVSVNNPIERVVYMAVIVNKNEVDAFKKKLDDAGAKMQNIEVLNIERAQGLTFTEVYVHITPVANEYVNGTQIDKYNSDMYTALRARDYIHITTLESTNIDDPSLQSRNIDMVNKIQNTGSEIRKDVNTIKMHLNPTVKPTPAAKGGSTTTAPNKATVVSPISFTTGLAVNPKHTNVPEQTKVLDSLKTLENHINSNIITPLNDLHSKKFTNDALIADIAKLQTELAAETDDAKKKDIEQKIKDLGTPEDEKTINDAISKLEDDLEIGKEDGAKLLDEFNILQTNGKPTTPSPHSDPFTQVVDFTIEGLSDETFSATSDSPQPIEFQSDDSQNPNSIINVSHPTSSSFTNIHEDIPTMLPGDNLIIVPVSKINKNLVGVYRMVVMNDGKTYYQELGALSTEMYERLKANGKFKNEKRLQARQFSNADVSAKNNLFQLIGHDENDTDSYVKAQLSNIETLYYNYEYANTSATQRDGMSYDTLLDTWCRTMGIDKKDISHSIKTISNKDYNKIKESYEKQYGPEFGYKTPVKPGRTYIVITRGKAQPQYIELEPRTLITDTVELSKPSNMVMNEWYMAPLMKFVTAVDEYDASIMNVLNTLGISKTDLDIVIEAAKKKEVVNGNTIVIAEEVSSFAHGNSFYNDLMYAFLNMSYDINKSTKWFKDKGDDGYKKVASELYTKLFTELQNPIHKGLVKDLMLKSRNVYAAVYNGTELNTVGKEYYDIDSFKMVDNNDGNSDYILPLISLKDTDFKLGGAQMAMNLIAYGNQNIQVNENGELVRISTGRLERSKDKKGQSKIQYVGRPLNGRVGLKVNAYMPIDRLYLTALLKTNSGNEIVFDGYQDELITKDYYNEIRKSDSSIMTYSDFISFVMTGINSNNITTSDEFDAFIETYLQKPEVQASWEAFQISVGDTINRHRSIGHNAGSIKNDILGNTSPDGTRNNLGSREYGSGTKQIGLRMNIPAFMDKQGSNNNWKVAQNSSSSFLPSQVTPEERFEMFFTSSFTGVNQTSLDVSIEDYDNNSGTSTPTDTGDMFDESEVAVNEEPESENGYVTEYYKGQALTNEQYQMYSQGNAVILDDGTTLYPTEDLDDHAEPFVFLKSSDASNDNNPSGMALTQFNDMFEYLNQFIPDLKHSDLQMLRSLQADELFGEQNGKVWGAFKNGVIYAIQNNPNDSIFKQVLKHEAFHKIFRQYLNNEERRLVLQQAREEYDLWGKNDLEVEEWLAVNFQKRPDFKRNSLLQRFLNFLKKIYGMIFRNQSAIEELYSKIEKGEFKQMVADEFQYKSEDAAFLSTLEHFKNEEHLIGVMKGLYNQSKIQTNDYGITSVNEGVWSNVPKSDYETVNATIQDLGKKLSNYKKRFLNTYGNTYYTKTENDYKEVSATDLKYLDSKSTKVYTLANGVYTEADVSNNMKPLTSTEFNQYLALQKVFARRIYNPATGTYEERLQGTNVYPHMIRFIADIYPSDLASVKRMMQVNQVFNDIEKAAQASIEERTSDEAIQAMSKEDYAQLQTDIESEKESLNMLAEVLNKDKSINPSKTLTDAAKTWISTLFITNADKSKSEINVKQALAIMYQTFSLFDTTSYSSFEKELMNAMGDSITNIKYKVNDINYLYDVLTTKRDTNAYKFLQRLASENNLEFNQENLLKISKIIEKEISSLVSSISKTGTYTKIALPSNNVNGKFTIFDLFKTSSFATELAGIYDDYQSANTRAQLDVLSDYDLLAQDVRKSVDKLYAARIRGLQTRKNNEDELTPDIISKYDIEQSELENEKSLELQSRLGGLDALGSNQLKELADNKRNTLKGKLLQNRLNTHSTDKAIKNVLRKAFVSGYTKQYGRPSELVIYNRLLALAKDVYSTQIEITDKRGLEKSYVFNKETYFIDENKFYIGGAIVYRDKQFKDGMYVRTRDTSNKEFFKRIYNALQKTTVVDNNNIHPEVISALYRKLKSNNIFLDIITNFNSLVPANLTKFDLTSQYGLYSSSNMNMLTAQESDTDYKSLLNINNALLESMKTVTNGIPSIDNENIKTFVKTHFKDFKSSNDIPVTSYDLIFKSFLEMIGQQHMYSEQTAYKSLKPAIESIYAISNKLATNSFFSKGPIDVAEDSNFDSNVLFKDNESYTKKIANYINRNKEIRSNTTTKDINKNTRFLRDRKTYSDALITTIYKYNTAPTESESSIYKAVLENRYPHLVQHSNFNFMMLNPFNPLVELDNNSKANKVDGFLHTLDGTSANDYPIEIGRETLKDIINRMVNGHFLGAMNRQLEGSTGLKQIYSTSYPIADKGKLKMLPTGVYGISTSRDIKNGRKNVHDMIKLMLQQRLMMPSKVPGLKTYSPWKDNQGLFLLSGLGTIEKSKMDALIAQTGNFKSMDELNAANINFSPFIDAIYSDMERQSNEIVDYILSSNQLALEVSNGSYLSAKYGIPIPSDLDAVYTSLYKAGLLDASAFENNDLISIEHAANGVGDKIILKDFSTKGSEYKVQPAHLKPLLNLFVANTYINDFFLNQLTMGDPAYLKNAIDVVKRMSTTHGNIVSPMVSPQHAPSKIRTVVTDDIETYTFKGIYFSDMPAGFKKNYEVKEFEELLKTLSVDDRILASKNYAKREWTDGGGMMSQRGRDALNKGYGSANQMQNSVKPLTHYIDPVTGPRNNKYALNVLTDSLCKQFPLMLSQRIKMDFHGLSAVDYARATELEMRRVNEGSLKLAENQELIKLYENATPIIQSVPLSAIKYGKIRTATKFNYAENNFTEFEPDSIIDFETADWGYQLDPEDNVDGKVSLPTQLLYFTNVNGNNPELEVAIVNAMIGLQNIQKLNYQSFGINGDKTTIANMSAAIIDSLNGKENQLNTQQALESNAKNINLPTFTTSAISSYNNIFQKSMLSLKFKGTKAVQVSEALTSDLNGDTLEWDSETQTAEVYMPASYMTMIKTVLPELTQSWFNERNSKKKLELEKQIIDALPVMMLGFRIPSTGPNSAVRIKIKGFMHDESNRVIIPNELAYRTGADFDIDTLYILRPEFLGSTVRDKAIAEHLGIDIKNPIGYTGYEGGLINGFEDKLIGLNTVTEVSTIVKDKDGNDVKRSFVISEKDIKKLKTSFYNNQFGISYMQLLKKTENLKDVNKALNFDRATSIQPEITKNANGENVFNDSLYVLLAGLKSPEFKTAYEAAKENMDNYDESILNPKVQDRLEKQMLSHIEKSYNLTDFFNRNDLQILNQTGKALTGVFASVSKTLAYIQSTLDSNFEISKGLQFDLNGIHYGGIESEINNPLNSNKNRFFDTNGISTFDELQWLVNAAVDNAKEQILAKLNINAVTSDIVTSALLVGVPMETQMVVLQQPVVKELIRLGKIDNETISFMKKQILKSTGVDVSKMSNDDLSVAINNALNGFSFYTSGETNATTIGLHEYVNANIRSKIQAQIAIKYSNLSNEHFLNPKSKNEFIFNNVNYPSLQDALDSNGNVSQLDIIREYFKALPSDILNNLNNIKSLSVSKKNEFENNLLTVFDEFKTTGYDNYIQMNPNTENDNRYFSAQLFTLNLLTNLSGIGKSVNKVRKVISLLSDAPNGQAEVLAYEETIADILDIAIENEFLKPDISNINTYENIVLPASIGKTGNYIDSVTDGKSKSVLPDGIDIALKNTFAIKNLDFSKLGNGLFKSVYEQWYNNDYMPVKTNIFLMHPEIANLSSKLQAIYKINPQTKAGEFMNKNEKDMLVRTQILKMLISKMIIKHPDMNGITQITKMDTVGIVEKQYENTINENQVLYENLLKHIQSRMLVESNRNNEFLLKMSAQKYNHFVRTGEIVMNRSNTSDPNELKSMQSAFLQIDNDLRQEYIKRNPSSSEYWLSPLQIEMIQYALVFEGLQFGSSKMSQFLPHSILSQFSDQLDTFFKDTVANNGFNNLEEWFALYFAAADPTWVRPINFKSLLTIDETLEIIGGIEKGDAEIIDMDDFTEMDADGKTIPKKPSKKGRTVKYDTLNKVYYHLASKREANQSLNAFPLFVQDSFQNRNHVTYIRINKDIPGVVYYLALPKTPSVTPKLPNQVLSKGFDVSSINNGNMTFFNEKAINNENGKLFLYNNAVLIPNSFIHVYDNTKGYLQNLTKYRVVNQSGSINETKYKEVLEKLDNKIISAKEKAQLQDQLKSFSLKYELELIQKDVPLQSNSTKAVSSLSNLEIAKVQNDSNNQIVNDLKLFMDQSDRNTFNAGYYTDEELKDLNERKQQITCK